jgi:hypothetical protein
MHFTLHRPTKLNGNGGPFGGIRSTMNSPTQIVLITQLASIRDSSLSAIKGQLHGIQKGGFPASIESTKEDDGATISFRGQNDFLMGTIDAKIVKGDGIKDHDKGNEAENKQ